MILCLVYTVLCLFLLIFSSSPGVFVHGHGLPPIIAALQKKNIYEMLGGTTQLYPDDWLFLLSKMITHHSTLIIDHQLVVPLTITNHGL